MTNPEEPRRPSVEPGFLAGDDDMDFDDAPPSFFTRPPDDDEDDYTVVVPPAADDELEEADEEAWQAFASRDETNVSEALSTPPAWEPPTASQDLPAPEPPPSGWRGQPVESHDDIFGEEPLPRALRLDPEDDDDAPWEDVPDLPPVRDPVADLPPVRDPVPDLPPVRDPVPDLPPVREPVADVPIVSAPMPEASISVPGPPDAIGDEAQARWRSDATDYDDTGWETITAEFRALRDEEADAPEPEAPAAAALAVEDDLFEDEEEDEFVPVAPRAPAPRRPAVSGRNLAVAVGTGAVFGLIALGAINWGRPAFFVVALAALLVGLVEFYTGARQAAYKPAVAPGLLGTFFMLWAPTARGPRPSASPWPWSWSSRCCGSYSGSSAPIPWPTWA